MNLPPATFTKTVFPVTKLSLPQLISSDLTTDVYRNSYRSEAKPCATDT